MQSTDVSNGAFFGLLSFYQLKPLRTCMAGVLKAEGVGSKGLHHLRDDTIPDHCNPGTRLYNVHIEERLG